MINVVFVFGYRFDPAGGLICPTLGARREEFDDVDIADRDASSRKRNVSSFMSRTGNTCSV